MERTLRDQDAGAAAQADAVADAESGTKVARRVVQVLEWQAFKTGRAAPITLSVLARDKGIQKYLGSRSLLPLLQTQCGGDDGAARSHFQLVNEESRGWCAHLPLEGYAPPRGAGPGHAGGADHARYTSVDDLAAACGGIEILAIVPGAVVVNKPCGITTETVVDWLQNVPPEAVRDEIERQKRQQEEEQKSQGKEEEEEEYVLESVSRLDKPTSGVLVVPLSRSSANSLTEQWKRRDVEKTYICLCSGVTPLTGHFDSKLRTLSRGRGSKTAPHPQGKEALTEYRRVGVYRGRGDQSGLQFSLCEVFPRTGRTHQIRAHFAHGGHPLAGDVKYGGPAVGGCIEEGGRLFLHSSRLRFVGVGGERHDVSAEIPRELAEVLQGLDKEDAE